MGMKFSTIERSLGVRRRYPLFHLFTKLRPTLLAYLFFVASFSGLQNVSVATATEVIKMDMAKPDSFDEQDFQRLLSELSGLKDKYVTPSLSWYEQHSWWPRVLFRTSGAVVVLLGASLPLLAAFTFPRKEIVLSVVSVVLAGLIGLNAFFHWDEKWRGFKQTELTISHSISVWDLKMIQARHEPEHGAARQLAIEATRDLLESTKQATASETKGYFKDIQFPKSGGK
jgi:hypothetical protein